MPDPLLSITPDIGKGNMMTLEVLGQTSIGSFRSRSKNVYTRQALIEHKFAWVSHHPSMCAACRKAIGQIPVCISDKHEANLSVWSHTERTRYTFDVQSTRSISTFCHKNSTSLNLTSKDKRCTNEMQFTVGLFSTQLSLRIHARAAVTAGGHQCMPNSLTKFAAWFSHRSAGLQYLPCLMRSSGKPE